MNSGHGLTLFFCTMLCLRTVFMSLYSSGVSSLPFCLSQICEDISLFPHSLVFTTITKLQNMPRITVSPERIRLKILSITTFSNQDLSWRKYNKGIQYFVSLYKNLVHFFGAFTLWVTILITGDDITPSDGRGLQW